MLGLLGKNKWCLILSIYPSWVCRMLGRGNVSSLDQCTSLRVRVGIMFLCCGDCHVPGLFSLEGTWGWGWNQIRRSVARSQTVLGSNFTGVVGWAWSLLVPIGSPNFLSGSMGLSCRVLRLSDPWRFWWPSQLCCVCACLEGTVGSIFSSSSVGLVILVMHNYLITCS